MRSNEADRSISSQNLDDRPRAVLDCPVLAADGIFEDRSRNQRLLDDFAPVTTQRVVDEADRIDAWVPDFVEVREVSLDRAIRREAAADGAGDLSPADLSLVRLARDLRAGGCEAYVTTEDDLLRDFARHGWNTGHLLDVALGEQECYEVLWYVPEVSAPGWEDEGVVA